jgi:hypothetical protein
MHRIYKYTVMSTEEYSMVRMSTVNLRRSVWMPRTYKYTVTSTEEYGR